MITKENNKIKIATLNLNGETFWSINKRPRLPRDLYDIKKIKNELCKKIIEGLDKILEEGKIDIIAIQELICIEKYKNQIETIVNKYNYKLKIPKDLRQKTHFTVGFIIKNDIKTADIVEYEGTEISVNKKILLSCEINKVKFLILNVHLTNHSDKISRCLKEFLDNNDTVSILLGDMNAYTNSQVETKGKPCSKADFIESLVKKDCRKDEWLDKNIDMNYTFWASKWKKLDHIFLNKNAAKKLNEIEEKKDDLVNYYSVNDGFTDHSMLIIEFKSKID